MKKKSPLKTVQDLSTALIQAWRQIVKTPGPSDLLQTREFRLCVSKVIELQALFQDGGSLQSSWLNSPSLGAFMVYYWPMYYQEALFLFQHHSRALGKVLDVASGPGPMTMAALEYAAKEVCALDANERCLMVLSEFIARLGHTLKVRQWVHPKPIELQEHFDTIIVGHTLLSLSEFDTQKAYLLIKKLTSLLQPGARILVIESNTPKHKQALTALLNLVQSHENELALATRGLESHVVPLERTQLMIDIMRSTKRVENRRPILTLVLDKSLS